MKPSKGWEKDLRSYIAMFNVYLKEPIPESVKIGLVNFVAQQITEAEQRGYEKAEIAQQNALNGLIKKHQRQAVEAFVKKLKKRAAYWEVTDTDKTISVSDIDKLLLESDRV